MTTLTRQQLIEELAAASTNLAIATHEEQEAWRIYDDNFENETNEVNQARFDVFAQKQNVRKQKWQLRENAKAALLERDEIAAALDKVKESQLIDRVERFSDYERAHRWQNGDGNQEATTAWGLAAVVLARQIVAHL